MQRRRFVHIAALGLGVIAVRRAFPGRPFDAELWRTGVEQEVRAGMADRLVAHSTLEGLSRDEIIDLLGQPDTADGSSWTYWLCSERSLFSIDSEWLEIDFDPNGRVFDALIVTD